MAQNEQLTREVEETEVESLWKRCSSAIALVSLLDRVSSLDGVLPEDQKMLTPAARAALLVWNTENQTTIKTAHLEDGVGAAQVLGGLMKKAPSLETIERFETCYEAALAGIAGAGR